MTSIGEWVAEAGGLVHKRDLVALGARDHDLTRAVRAGEVRRPRRGWYSVFDPRDPRFEAARVGGRLTGLAALALWGAWVWRKPVKASVSVPSNASRLRSAHRVRVVYDPPRVVARGTPSMVDPRDALVRAVSELGDDFESAVALWDWAVTCGHFAPDALAEAEALLSEDRRGLVEWSSPASQSVIESVARVRLQREGLRVECQRTAPGVTPIDLLVEGVVALELDGREYHESRFEHDRQKDLAITRTGWQAVRASYAMVRTRWGQIERGVRVALEHHAPPRPQTSAEGNAGGTGRLPPVRRQARRGRRTRWRCPSVSRESSIGRESPISRESSSSRARRRR